jgi:Dna[CI] antecedent, DciA
MSAAGSLEPKAQNRKPKSQSRKPEPMNRASTALESVISKALHQAPAAESVLLAWPVACGSAVADRTRAVGFAGGVLRVEVADKGWQRELTALAPRYVAEINRFAAARVERVEFVVKSSL